MDNPTRATCIWTRDDEATLVRALRKAKEEAKWGDNNPKPATWTACVEALAGSERVSGGQPKDARAVKRRWQRVSAHSISALYARLQVSLQLKQEYEIFKNMRAQSGWGWDHDKNIPDVSDEVWEAYMIVRLSYTMMRQ